MKMRKMLALLVAVVMLAALFAGCQDTNNNTSSTPPPSGNNTPGEVVDNDTTGHRDPKEYTFNDFMQSFGTDWNPHTWETNADSAVLDYLSSGLYGFRFNDSLSAELYPLMAAEAPVDITSSLTADQKAKYDIPADADTGYAYQYTLREGMAFEDGTPINAQLFADSLQLMLDPNRQNGRSATVTTGESAIAGSVGYFNYGSVSCVPADADSDISGGFYYSMKAPITWWGGSIASIINDGYGSYFLDADGNSYIDKWDNFAQENGGYNKAGYSLIPEEALEEFEADWTEVCNSIGGGYEGEWKEFGFITGVDYTDPKYGDFSNVGIIVDDELVMTFIHSVKVSPFNAMYYQTSTWLVHPGLYEQYSTTEGDLLTTAYMTTKDNSISYGPYTLASYEADKEMLFTRNESWFGYQLEELRGTYQPDNIRVKKISEQATALLSFLKGELDFVNLVATDLVDYGTSEYLQVAPNSYLYRFFYNLDSDVLKTLDADDSSSSNSVALTNKNFRLALSAAIDRIELTKISNRTPALAMLSESYTYDFEGELVDGAQYRYRHLDAAKEAILNIYDITYGSGTEYATLDIAVDSITGYDPDYAKELMKLAFDELSANAPDNGFDPSKPINIRVGYTPTTISPTALAIQNELNAKFAAAIDGSGFAGFTFEFVVDEDRYGAVTEGRLACSYGAIGGARQDPWGITDTFLNPADSLFLGAAIPVTTDMLEITVDGVASTKTLYDWWVALKGEYMEAAVETKAQILSAIESHYLKQGYTTVIESGVDTMLRSIRAEYPLDEPDPNMVFGGLQYVTFSMDDAEWAEFISGNTTDGSLAYK